MKPAVATMSVVERGPAAGLPVASTQTGTFDPGTAVLGTAAWSVTWCPGGYVQVAVAR
jgi:hypothetical protein